MTLIVLFTPHYILYFSSYLVYIHILVMRDITGGGLELSIQKKLAEDRQTRPAGGGQSKTKTESRGDSGKEK